MSLHPASSRKIAELDQKVASHCENGAAAVGTPSTQSLAAASSNTSRILPQKRYQSWILSSSANQHVSFLPCALATPVDNEATDGAVAQVHIELFIAFYQMIFSYFGCAASALLNIVCVSTVLVRQYCFSWSRKRPRMRSVATSVVLALYTSTLPLWAEGQVCQPIACCCSICDDFIYHVLSDEVI
jgi:hypothetical protein